MNSLILEEIAAKEQLLKDIQASDYLDNVSFAATQLSKILASGNKILLAGNGGSAADAQHFAGEMVGRFLKNRKSLPALSLSVDPSVMTCIGNDYGYHEVFSRQLEGLGHQGDAFIAISTSGNSQNLIQAVQTARENGLFVIGMLGKNGGELKSLCNIALIVPSNSTPRIQETHTFTVHLLCELIENNLFK